MITLQPKKPTMNFLLYALSFLALSTTSNAFSTLVQRTDSSCSFRSTITSTGSSTSTACNLLKLKNTKVRYGYRSQEEGKSSHLLSSLSEDGSERNLGLLVLLTVPFAWGTFEPAVRFVYGIEPPVPALVFSLGYYLVAATSLGFLTLMSSQDSEEGNSQLAIRGGLELGTYLFIGNGLQVLGLQTVSADRAAFLLQLTTIFVPLVQGVINGDMRSIPNKTWGACFIALLGVAVISLDGIEGPLLENAAKVLTNFSQGDIFVMAAAFSYTFHCIRLERFAKESSALQLAACKAATETALTLLLLGSIFGVSRLGGDLFSAEATSDDIISFFQSNNLVANPALPSAILAIVWTGLVPVAYTIYAQSFGQSRVSPTDANLIYTIQPVCTAVFAWALLGETLGPTGYAGGALIGSAVYLVATDSGGGD